MVDTLISTLVLPAESNSLVIETSEDHWASCFLVGTERIYLGADDLSVILARLRKVISNEDLPDRPADGEIEGFSVAWVLSLAEAHHILYAAVSGEDYLFLWQNAHHSPVSLAGTMRLTPQHQRQWQEQLDAFQRQVIYEPIVPLAAVALK